MRAPKMPKSNGTSKQATPSTPSNFKVSAVPAWPALPTPEQRSHELEIEEILPSQILLIHGFFSSKACANWLSFVSDTQHIPLQATPPAQKGEAARTNHRFSVTDEAFAQRLWLETGLEELVRSQAYAKVFVSSEKPGSKPVGLNPNIRIYRYEPGQAFAPHYDDTVNVNGRHTEWTLLIYLSGASDGVEGGETAFYPSGTAPTEAGKMRRRKLRPGEEDVVVKLERGTALLHRHGRECLLHEGRPVLTGVKWVLRSDVVLG